jgi:hypothetical protein
MALRWKFWRRADRKSAVAPAEPAAPSPTNGWMPLTSARELLGLQRVVGNQAVLELLAVREARSQVKSD